MPPEEALGSEVTPQADLYSLGAMLYELVTGRPPFESDSPTAVISQHVKTPPAAPSYSSDHCPPDLEELILRLLAKAPAQRPASASEVRAALERVDPEARSASHSHTSASPLDRLARSRVRSPAAPPFWTPMGPLASPPPLNRIASTPLHNPRAVRSEGGEQMVEDTQVPVPAVLEEHQAARGPALGQRIPIEDFGVTLRVIPGKDLTGGEIDRAVDLLRLAFNGGPGWFSLPVAEADHLRWKLADTPFESQAVMIEDAADRMVGFSGRFFRRWLVRGEVRIGRAGGELALHPDYQGSGLYGRRREVTNGFPRSEDFRISFGSHPASLHRRMKEGRPNLANPLDNLVRPLDLAEFVSRRAAGTRPTSSRTRIALDGKRRRLPRPVIAKLVVWQGRLLRQRLRYRPLHFPQDRFTLRTVERFDERIEPFFEAAARPFALIQLRDQRTLNWRYGDPRGGPFTIRLAESGDEIVGYAVTRATASGAELVDLLALPGREDVAYALIRDAVDLGRRAGSPAIRSWMLEHHPYHPLLLHSGFLPNRRIVVPGFTDNGNGEEYGFIHDPHAPIHLMLGDSDHV